MRFRGMVNGSRDFKPRENSSGINTGSSGSIEYARENDSKYLNSFHILTAEYKTDPTIQAEIDKYEESLNELKLKLGLL